MSLCSRVQHECSILENCFIHGQGQQEGLLKLLRDLVAELDLVGPSVLQGWTGDLYRVMKTVCFTPNTSDAGWQGCVKKILSQGYTPLLLAAVKHQPGEWELTKALAEHLEMLQKFGCDVSDIVSRKVHRQDPNLVHYGLANAVWTGITSVWASIPPQLEDTLGSYGVSKILTCECIISCMRDTVDMARHGHLEEKACKKLVQFWLSNLGRLVKESPVAAEGILDTFWKWIIEFSSMNNDSDMANFVARAFVACLNQIQQSTVESTFVKPVAARIRTGGTHSNHIQRIVCSIFSHSDRFTKQLCCCMVPLFESILEGCVALKMHACMDFEMVEDAVFEFVSACMSIDVDVGLDTVSTIVGYAFCPHPVLEEIVCRVCMDVMVCSGPSFQYALTRVIKDALVNNMSHWMTCEVHTCLPASLEQGCALLGSALSCALPSTVERVLQETAGALQRSGELIPVWDIVESAVVLRCFNLSKRVLGASATAYIQGIVALAKRACEALPSPGLTKEDNNFAAKWMSELLYQIFYYYSKCPHGLSKAAVDAQTCVGVLRKWISSPSMGPRGSIVACNLQRIEMLMYIEKDRIGKFNPPGMTTLTERSPLEIFSAEQETGGWLTETLRVSVEQHSFSTLKSIFAEIFESTNSSYPLQYLAIRTYLEYISQCPQENITRVLPDIFVTGQGVAQSFKNRLQKFLTVGKWVEEEDSESNGVILAQKMSMLSDASSLLECYALKKHECKPKSKSDPHLDSTDDIHYLLEKASKSVLGLVDALDSSSLALTSPNKRALKRTFEEIDQNMARVKKACM